MSWSKSFINCSRIYPHTTFKVSRLSPLPVKKIKSDTLASLTGSTGATGPTGQHRAMQLKDVIAELKSMGNPKAAAGMARYGIKADRALGVSIPQLQGLAKEIQQLESKAARWVAGDALRELRSENVQKRLSGRAKRQIAAQRRLSLYSSSCAAPSSIWVFLRRVLKNYPTKTHSTNPRAEEITLTASSTFNVAVLTTRS